jgi:hypothetical protein
MSNSSNVPNDVIAKFIEAKQKIAEWEKRHEKYKTQLEEYMRDRDLTTIDHTNDGTSYQIKKLIMNRETLCKKDVPADIWERYSKSTRYTMIRVDKKNNKK